MGQLTKTTDKVNELLEKVEGMPEEVKDGKTPVLETGTTTTLDPGQNATSEVVASGEDENGNPKYKLNFGIPKGYDGAGGSGGGGVADSVQWTNVLNKPSWVNSSTKPTYTASEVGALPSDTQIPSKTSQLTNDSGFTTSASFKTVNGQSIVGSGNIVIEGGGGGTPSAGGGNVNVTNGSALQSANYYAFKPSADGSLDGTFNVIPEASEAKEGLMSSTDKTKLNILKGIFALDIAAETLTDNSTSDEILQVFKPTLNSIDELFRLIIEYTGFYKSNHNSKMAEFYIGNIRTDAMFAYDEEKETGTMQLTWVNNGMLKTLTITSTTETLSCKVTEMGGGANNAYYIPSDVDNLTSESTPEDILEAFGGEDALQKVIQAVKDKRELYIYSNASNIVGKIINVDAYFVLTSVLRIWYLDCTATNKIKIIAWYKNAGTGSEVKILYPEGYDLAPEVYSLTSSSSSEDISTAVGGESGLKNIIQAIKDGNRLVIRGTNDSFGNTTVNQDLICNGYEESGNGDINLMISGIGYGLFGGFAGILSISYTKSSNTFSCAYTPIS